MSEYATVDEFWVHGLPQVATGTTDAVQTAIRGAIRAASAIADGVIRARGYPTPLTNWDLDLVMVTCKIAAYEFTFHYRGANPATPGHEAIVAGRMWALDHLKEVAKGLISLSNTTPERKRQGVASVIHTECGDTPDGTRGW